VDSAPGLRSAPSQYDKECGGLFISVSPTSPATFYLKYTCEVLKQRRTYRMGLYHPQIFTPMHARAAAMQLRVRADHGEDIQQAKRQARSEQAKLGVTVDRVIAERVTWMSTLVRKADGEMRARIESWESVDRIFDRFVCPRLGKMIASEVTARDIAELSDAIVAGRMGKPSASNARHMRRAVSGLFRWAAQPSRGYVSASPCINLEPLDREPPRTRKLSPDEIAVLWRGLDRPDMHWDRRTCLAIKFALTSMLRSTELLHIHRDELVDLDGKFPRVDVAMKRVKKRRVIHQPLSSLAVEIVRGHSAITSTSSLAGSAPTRCTARRWQTHCAGPGGSGTARRSSSRSASARCSGSNRSRHTICEGRQQACWAASVCRARPLRPASITR
jgi:hypothetical protein